MKNKYRHNDDGSTTIFIESKKYGTKEVLIDTEDRSTVDKHYWHLYTDKNENVFYARTSVLHPDGGWKVNKTDGRRRRRRLMRAMPHMVLEKPKHPMVIDHIDGNGLNNRKSNLRITTNSSNQHNRVIAPSKSGYTGAKHDPRCRTKPWYAAIRMSPNKIKHLGMFSTKEEAAQAHDLAVVKHREIVNPERQLNFPEKLEEYKASLARENKGDDNKK